MKIRKLRISKSTEGFRITTHEEFVVLDMYIRKIYAGSNILELGAISSDFYYSGDEDDMFKRNNIDINNFNDILDKYLINLIKDKSKVYIANLINLAHIYIKLEEAFIRTKTFKLVKTFTNLNTGNEIKVWISE